MADELSELLASVGHTSDETEFYSPMPQGYVKGKTKYVVVVGTVMSGLGKGIFASSLAKILKDKGLKVAPIKMKATSTSTPAPSTPSATAKCSSSKTAWKPTWTWAPMNA